MDSSPLPFQLGKRPDDVTTLAKNSILARLAARELGLVLDYLDQVALTRGTVVTRQAERGDYFFIVLEGEVRLTRGGVEVRVVGPGGGFGQLALLGAKERAEVTALTTLRLARLSRARFDSLASNHATLALHLLQALLREANEELSEMTDRVGGLLRERSLPRGAEVLVRRNGSTTPVATGTPLGALLPEDVHGEPVIAALVDRKPAGLETPLTSDARVEPVVLRSADGRAIYGRSVGLALLEAARRAAPESHVRLSTPLLGGRLVEVSGAALPGGAAAMEELTERLTKELEALVRAAVPFHEELWTLEEAIRHFTDMGAHGTALLLQSSREPTVPLLRCGGSSCLAVGPAVRDTSVLHGYRLVPHPAGLVLDIGVPDDVTPPGWVEEEVRSPCHRGEMALEHLAWLRRMGIDSVGAFNDACVRSDVAEIVRLSEGFHEKRIGRIADQVAARRGGVKIITVAGPSSSGKTTFIKRLTVQLEIDGIRPVQLSTDDYYVDREKTARDEHGELDFEAIEAIDLALLQDHVRRLLAGETVRTARYDFHTGKSDPQGGAEVRLDAGDLLLIEGIHGLNPALLGASAPEGAVFRIFIQPSTTLAFDDLTTVDPNDVRLLRRIVRDRHHRGYAARETIVRWPSVRRGERHILPFRRNADETFDSALIYEPAVVKVFAERYLLEVPPGDEAYPVAYRLRQLVDRYVAIYPDHVPPTSLVREFIGGSGFRY